MPINGKVRATKITISRALANVKAIHLVKNPFVFEKSKNKKKIGPKDNAKIICNQFKI